MSYASMFMDDAAAERAALDKKIEQVNAVLMKPTPRDADDKVLYERQALEKQLSAMRAMSAALAVRIEQQAAQ